MDTGETDEYKDNYGQDDERDYPDYRGDSPDSRSDEDALQSHQPSHLGPALLAGCMSAIAVGGLLATLVLSLGGGTQQQQHINTGRYVGDSTQRIPERQGATPSSAAQQPVTMSTYQKSTQHTIGTQSQRVVVTGTVLEVRATGTNEKLFWGVPEGLGAVTLSSTLEKDSSDVQMCAICVFPGGVPIIIKPGHQVRISGKPGKLTPSGVRVYTECELEK